MGKLVSLKVTENSAIRQTTRDFLLAFHNNYVPILHHFGDIARYWSKIVDWKLPHLYLASPLGVTSLEFRRDLWHQKTRILGLSSVVPACDGRTDRRTDTGQQHIQSFSRQDQLRW